MADEHEQFFAATIIIVRTSDGTVGLMRFDKHEARSRVTQLHECGTCGCLVTTQQIDTHVAWHALIAQAPEDPHG